MKNNEIEKLIYLYLQGTISPTEKDELFHWQNENEMNQQTFKNVKDAWNKMQLLEQMQKYNSAKALRKIHSRTEKKHKVNPIHAFQQIAAMLLFPLLLTTLYFVLKKPHQTEPFVAWNKIETSAGMRSEFHLPDSTKVYLNANTSLSYPIEFNNDFREVTLTGEAFFEVSSNEEVPFIVNTGRVNIEVTGTEFLVTRYPHENSTEIVLTEGGITLFQGNYITTKKEITKLTPGQKAICPDDDSRMSVEKTDTEKYTSWKKGILMFRDDPMPEVVLRLNRWFNVEIKLEGVELKDWAYTATFEDESLEQVLELLKISAPVDYIIKRRKYKPDKTFSKMEVVIRKI